MKLIKRICPNPIKGLDDRLYIETSKGILSESDILTLRGLYDSYHSTPLIPDDVDVSNLTDEDIEKYSKILAEFRKKVKNKDIQDQRLARMRLVTNNVSKANLILNTFYRGRTKIRRIAMVAELFHQCLEEYKKDNGLIGQDNSEIITQHFGSPLNFIIPTRDQSKNKAASTVKARLLYQYKQYQKELETTIDNSRKQFLQHAIDELEQILKNKELFISLCVMASSQIKENDGVKLSLDLSYTLGSDTEETAYSDVDYVLNEETKKDGWMEHTDEISSFKSLGRAVKNVLKFLPSYQVNDKGEYIIIGNKGVEQLDDCGFSVYENPLAIHRVLLEMSETITDDNDFLTAIEAMSTINPVFSDLYSRLKNNRELLSAFRQEYYRTRIEYRGLSTKEGMMKSFVLSGNFVTKNKIFKNWINNLAKRKQILTNSIFKILDASTAEDYENQNIKAYVGNVVFDRVKTEEFLNYIKEWFVPVDGDIFKRTKFQSASLKDKQTVMLKALEYLNIQISKQDLHTLFATGKFSTIANQLSRIQSQNFITGEAFKTTAEGFIKSKVGGEAAFLEDAITKICVAVDSAIPRKQESSVRWQDKTLHNHVLPSLLSNIIDTMKKLKGKNSALRKYLEDEFFISSQFRKVINGKPVIFNRLLSDLYQDESLQPVVDELLENLIISRTLGTTDSDFTEFTPTEHLEALLTGFFGGYKTGNIQYITEEKYKELRDSKSLKHAIKYYIEGTPYYYYRGKRYSRNSYGIFSTFILGDANQLKSVKMPIYSYNECVESLYHLALSEIEYYKQRVAANEELKKEGIQETIRTDRVFGYLTFLNEVDEFKNIGNIDEALDLEKLIKEKIEEFLLGKKDSEGNIIKQGEVDKIITRIKEGNLEGVLLEKLKESYPNTSKEELLSIAVRDFVANYAVSLANIQQISTISASMFDGSKDFAKRNKGTHSNGKQLNIKAFNPFTKKNFTEEDSYQKTIIANEVLLDINEIDEHFIPALKQMGLSEEAINEYTRKPIKSTDGQGYRIIDSYYKLKVMTGEAIDTNITEWYTKYKELQKRCRAEGRTTFNQEEIAELEAIGYTPQPNKPITQAINRFALNDGNVLLIPQQHKYAEIILIPEMLPEGSRLKAIAEAMQSENENDLAEGKTNVDLVVFNTGVKVGSYAEVEVYKGKDGKQLSAAEVKNAIKNRSKLRHGIHKVGLKYMKMQTNSPEHVFDSRAVGTQLRKLVLQGIKKGADYSHYLSHLKGKRLRLSATRSTKLNAVKGNHIAQLYNALISANFIEDYKKLKKTIKNKEKLSESLIQQLILGTKGNINDILAYTLENGEFFAPLFDNIREHDAASNILSIYRKIVNKQKMLGGSAVQAAAFGITEKEESENLHYIYDDNGNIIGAECEMAWDIKVTNPDGTQTELKFEDWCDENGELKKDKEGNILLDKYYPNARKLIAYRIPTEDFYSVMNLTIVRFTRKTATGGVIKVPMQGVTQAGFDFDIDKLYFIRYEYKQTKQELTQKEIAKIWDDFYASHADIYQELKFAQFDHFNKTGEKLDLEDFWGKTPNTSGLDKQQVFNEQASISIGIKYEEYNPELTPLENTRTARNNMLFDLIWARMQDPNTARMRLTPGGFIHASKAARLLRHLTFDKKKCKKANVKNVDDLNKLAKNTPDPEPDYSVLSVDTLLTYNEMNQIADKLIGVFANHNSNAMMSSLLHKFKINNAHKILFGSLLNNNVRLRRGDGEPYTDGIGTDLLADTIEYLDNEGNVISTGNILTNVHELIAAAVDAVKDPVLNYLGLTTTTATAAALLGRLGYTATDVGLLFNQPIVKELYKLINEGLSVSAACKILKNKVSKKGTIATSTQNLTEELLISNLLSDNALEEHTSEQLAVLDMIKEILAVSDRLNRFVGITKNTAANSVGSSFSQLYNTMHKYAKSLKEFSEEDSILEMELSDNAEVNNLPVRNDLNVSTIDSEEYLDKILDSPFAYEQTAFDCNRSFIEELKDIFPYETELYKNIRKKAYELSNSDNLSEETLDALHRDIILMVLSSRGSSYFDPYNKIQLGDAKLNISTFYLENFPQILHEVLNPTTKEDYEYLEKLKKEYPIFNYIEVLVNENPNSEGANYNIYIRGFKDGLKDYKYELTCMFEEAFFSEDATVRSAMMGIIMNQYFKTGFRFTKSSFADLLSPEIMDTITINREGETYTEVLNMILHDIIDIDPEKMVLQFIQNNPENTDFVMIPKKKTLNTILELFKKVETIEDSEGHKHQIATVKIEDALNNGIAIKRVNNDEVAIVPKKFLNLNGSLYRCISEESMSETGDFKYIKMTILSRGVVKKYTTYTSQVVQNMNVEESQQSEDTPADDNDITGVYTIEDVIDAYERYNLTINDARSTYMSAMQEILGLKSISELPAEYASWDKQGVYKGLTEIFNKYNLTIRVLDQDGEYKELC